MIEFVNSPLGAAILVVVALVVQSFGPSWLKPLAAALLKRVRGTAPEPEPQPEPEPEPEPTDTGRPVIDLARKVLGDLARRRFPAAATEDEAVERYLVNEASLEHWRQDAERAANRSAAELPGG